ncbi:hypothetical protein ACOSP7_005284 [Xanthoceras sorbifolium]
MIDSVIGRNWADNHKDNTPMVRELRDKDSYTASKQGNKDTEHIEFVPAMEAVEVDLPDTSYLHWLHFGMLVGVHIASAEEDTTPSPRRVAEQASQNPHNHHRRQYPIKLPSSPGCVSLSLYLVTDENALLFS